MFFLARGFPVQAALEGKDVTVLVEGGLKTREDIGETERERAAAFKPDLLFSRFEFCSGSPEREGNTLLWVSNVHHTFHLAGIIVFVVDPDERKLTSFTLLRENLSFLSSKTLCCP